MIENVKLEGDKEGIDVLKALSAKSPEGLKMLIGEARTNGDHTAYFKSEDGSRRYALKFVPVTGALVVEPA